MLSLMVAPRTVAFRTALKCVMLASIVVLRSEIEKAAIANGRRKGVAKVHSRNRLGMGTKAQGRGVATGREKTGAEEKG